MKKLEFNFEVKAVNEKGQFEGLASTFGNVDYGLDVVMKGAFKGCLRQMRKAGTTPGLFFQHDPNMPIGEWQEMSETEDGLFAKGQLWIEGNPLGRAPVEKAAVAHNMMLSSGPKGLSIGYTADKFDFEKRSYKIPSGPSKGEERDVMVRRLKAVTLGEVSVVTFPMNDKAEITGVKNLIKDFDKNSPRELEGVLRELGYTKSESRAIISGGYSAYRCDAEKSERCDADLSQDAIADLISTINRY